MEVITVQKRNPEMRAKKLRSSGFVPGVVFGGSLKESVSIQMDEGTAQKLVRTKREGSKLKLDLDGKTLSVQVKEKEQNVLKNEIVHISFQVLEEDQKVNSVIHIILKNADMITGSIERMLLEIPYASLPEDMIDTITVDLEGMKTGTAVTVADIPELQSDKIELQVDPESIIIRLSDKLRAAKQAAEK